MPQDPVNAVFLSYASQDAGVARRICEALRAAGVEVWFDQSELRGGDAWDAKIRKQIRECALFVPVISANTQQRLEGYFRLEWKLAEDRSHLIAKTKPFIVPAVIDGTSERDAHVPEVFLAVQWIHLPDNSGTDAFAARINALLNPAESGRPVSPARGTTRRAHDERKRFPVEIAVLAGVLVAASLGFWYFQHTATTRPKSGQPATAPLPALTTDKSIAVLPFANASEDKEGTSFFSDGVQEDVLTNLSLIRQFRVVSRTSVEQYRSTTKPIPQIARELGVTYVLEGSVRRIGNKVRVTGQLIQAASDEHLWARSYDRDLIDIFAIQAELAREIAAALQTTLSPEEKSLVARRPTESLPAYDLFLKAREAENREFDGALRWKRQIAFLQGAVQLDAGFAEAWAELARWHSRLYFSQQDHSATRLAAAKEAIDNATRLAPGSPFVQLRVGYYQYWGLRDYDTATAQVRKLIDLQPLNAANYQLLAALQRRQGRWSEALVSWRKEAELDPASSSASGNLLGTLWAARRFREAIAESTRLTAVRWTAGFLPESSEGIQVRYNDAFSAYRANGSKVEVEEFFRLLSPALRNSPRGLSIRRTWARVTGNFSEAAQLDRIQPYFTETGGLGYGQAVNGAMTLLALGDRDAARARLREPLAQLRETLSTQSENPNRLAELSMMEALLDDKEAALRDARHAVELLPESRDALEGPDFTYTLALVYAWTGDKDRAIAEFARQLKIPQTGFTIHTLRMNASTFPLHGDPAFEALLDDPKNNAALF